MKHHPHPGEILRETVFVPLGLGGRKQLKNSDYRARHFREC